DPAEQILNPQKTGARLEETLADLALAVQNILTALDEPRVIQAKHIVKLRRIEHPQEFLQNAVFEDLGGSLIGLCFIPGKQSLAAALAAHAGKLPPIAAGQYPAQAEHGVVVQKVVGSTLGD